MKTGTVNDKKGLSLTYIAVDYSEGVEVQVPEELSGDDVRVVPDQGEEPGAVVAGERARGRLPQVLTHSRYHVADQVHL